MSNVSTPDLKSYRFCLAPMMEWSTKHCRYFWRLLSSHSRLYTEMVTAGAIIHGDKQRFLDFNAQEHPIGLQVGGSDPKDLAQCAVAAQQWGYDEINLNCGCPSDRVQNGMIGAILMQHPSKVADCIKSMQDACDIDVTIKHRIGVDDMDDEAGLFSFVETVANTGCKTFIVHARKAWLKGLSPKENREVPPLRYDLVNALKQAFPELNIVINGGITTLDQSATLLDHVDGVMVGREAYHNPYILANVDQRLFGAQHNVTSRQEVLINFIEYVDQQIEQGEKLHYMSKHILGLYHGEHNGKAFRRYISENAYKPHANSDVLKQALKLVEKQPLL